mgnify:CR=1 FL=1
MEHNPPVILPVQERTDLPKQKPLHPNLPEPPNLWVLISPIKTGKSTILNNILLNDNFYGQDYWDKVKIISNTIHADNTSRFLLKAFDCEDHYADHMIEDIITEQKKFEKVDQPSMCVVLDDCLGSIRREASINHFCSRFRHYLGVGATVMISSQNFRMVSPIIRQNATAVIIGSPFPNHKELLKVAEEYGDMFGGQENWLKIYTLATPNRYDFLFMNLNENPAVAYSSFLKGVAIGDKIVGHDGNIDITDITEKKKDIDEKKILDNI